MEYLYPGIVDVSCLVGLSLGLVKLYAGFHIVSVCIPFFKFYFLGYLMNLHFKRYPPSPLSHTHSSSLCFYEDALIPTHALQPQRPDIRLHWGKETSQSQGLSLLLILDSSQFSN